MQAALGLRATGTRAESPESNITGAELPGGWYMVVANRDGLHLTSDYFFDVPVALVHDLTSWRHDHVIAGLANDAFEVLAATTVATPRKTESTSLWKGWFGS